MAVPGAGDAADGVHGRPGTLALWGRYRFGAVRRPASPVHRQVRGALRDDAQGRVRVGRAEQASRAAFAAAWGQPVYEDANITVFAVPPAARDWAESDFAAVGTGWHGVEAWDGVPTRWLGRKAACSSNGPMPGEYRLRFTAYPYLRNRTIRVIVNGTPADEIVVGTWQSVETRTFSLASGVNQVEIRVVEGCEKPSEVRGEDDARCLSIAVQRVELVQ